MSLGKFVKLTRIRWLICRPFPRNCSTVRMVSAGPPSA